jgi:hypothetical protein
MKKNHTPITSLTTIKEVAETLTKEEFYALLRLDNATKPTGFVA